MVDTTDASFAGREEKRPPATAGRPLVYRHRLATRVTHWIWAASMLFLLMSGLQIFNAHPALYIGQQSAFEFDNSVLVIGSAKGADGTLTGQTSLFGTSFDTTGVLGLSGPAQNPAQRAFPSYLTIPSYQDLGTGRVVHFFFGWVLVAAFSLWFVHALVTGHLRRAILPTLRDLKALPKSLLDHLRFRFHHGADYNVLQKLAYAGVLVVLFPLVILTGLTMSPGMNAAWPFLVDLFGGRQTARTLHFVAMLLIVGFFFIHIAMVLLAGPFNEMRSMITGWYRADAPQCEGRD